MQNLKETEVSNIQGMAYKIEWSREKYRFSLAFLLLGGFIALIAVAMIGGYADPLVLAGVFSGWIAAIIGFYFIQQNAEDAIAQAGKATELSSEIKTEAVRKVTEIGSISDTTFEMVQDAVKKQTAQLRETAKKKDALIAEMLAELEKTTG
ncbi:MAG: hypothetical protein LUQ09_05030 [Methanomassiliicoccales archaeon]|nr:hypothetical protein [Methanomassiliicoccales archaeon]